MGFRDARSGLPRQTYEHAFVSRPRRVFAFHILILYLRFCFLFFFWIYLYPTNRSSSYIMTHEAFRRQQRCNVENNDHIICALACLFSRDVSSSKLNEDFIINCLADVHLHRKLSFWKLTLFLSQKLDFPGGICHLSMFVVRLGWTFCGVTTRHIGA